MSIMKYLVELMVVIIEVSKTGLNREEFVKNGLMIIFKFLLLTYNIYNTVLKRTSVEIHFQVFLPIAILLTQQCDRNTVNL